jgi:cell division protein ZapA
MGELSIKIKIADREYPIRASASQEERLRRAGKEINDKLRELRAQLGIDDKQDLLAMIAINSMVEKLILEDDRKKLHSTISNKIEHIHSLVSSAI